MSTFQVSLFTNVMKWLLGIDRGVLKPGAEWKLGWANLPSIWIIVLLIIPAVIGFSYFVYRFEPSLPTGKQVVLGGLRLLAITIILLMLFQPYLYNEIKLKRESHLTVLVDNSKSMNLNDSFYDQDVRERLQKLMSSENQGDSSRTDDLNSLSRLQILNRIFQNKDLSLLENMSKDQVLKLYTFAQNLSVHEPDSKIKVAENGGATAIGSALMETYKKQQGQKTSGIVLFTDGQSNVGTDTLTVVRRKKQQGKSIPIYTVAVGSRHKPKDVSITNIEAPDAAQANPKDPVVFKVRIRGEGPEQLGTANLTLRTRDGEQLAQKELTVRGENWEGVKKIKWKPEEPGKYHLKVTIGPIADEIQEKNNSKRHAIRVVDQKIDVFYLEGLPRYEYRFLKNALIRDESLNVRVLLYSADEQYPQPSSPGLKPARKFPSTRKELSKYDVILIGDVHPRMFRSIGTNTETVLKRLKDFVNQMGGGIAFIAGPRYNLIELADTSIGPMMPVLMNSSPGRQGGTKPFHPRLTTVGKKHPVMQLVSDRQKNIELWENRDPEEYSLEPLRWYFPVRKARLGAKTLARVPEDVSDRDNVPLITSYRFGRGRTLYVGTDDTWVWRKIVGDEYFYTFWNNAIRWLRGGRLSSNKRYSLRIEKQQYNPGEEVIVHAHVLNSEYRPETSETIPLHILHESSNREKTVQLKKQDKAGNFKASYRPRELGSYTIWIGDYPIGGNSTSETSDSDYAEDSFRVKPLNLEGKNPSVNATLLKKIASISGGRFMYLDEIRTTTDKRKQILPDLVHQKPETISLRPQREDLWDAPLFIFLFVMLLGVEWILRKQARLI